MTLYQELTLLPGLAQTDKRVWFDGRPVADVNWGETEAKVNYLIQSRAPQLSYDVETDGQVLSRALRLKKSDLARAYGMSIDRAFLHNTSEGLK